MEWLERKYVNLLTSSLRNFKWKKNNVANCSCPVCGDSHTNKFKARFFFLTRNGKYHVFCHNCGVSKRFTTFLKDFNPELYQQFTIEALSEVGKKSQETQIVTDTKTPTIAAELTLKRVNQFPTTHIAKKYCDSRQIPPLQQQRLYYAENFMGWVNSLIPEKFAFTVDEPRLVIPFFWTDGNMFAFQGRALDDSKIRYITITLDYDKPKLFGLERVDIHEKYYVLEGPIDSLFVPNSIAMAGSDVADNAFINKNAVFVIDNQPRNKEVVNKYQKLIATKKKVVIWPESLEQKDVNEMVLAGKSLTDVKNIIDSSTVSGLEAELRLQSWRKV